MKAITEVPARSAFISRTFRWSVPVMVMLLSLVACQSLSMEEPGPLYEPLQEQFKREGLISSNTYQVHVIVSAADAGEARSVGRPLALERALESILKEPSLHSNMSFHGQQQIKNLVYEEGRVVRIHQKDAQHWFVIMQVYRNGLKDYLRSLY
ncbi:MAG: hypothetical protein KDK34_24330 [Leptospiraceae bacterium]|nr:hypothetical protein [Leptospiraceae bacterium]